MSTINEHQSEVSQGIHILNILEDLKNKNQEGEMNNVIQEIISTGSVREKRLWKHQFLEEINAKDTLLFLIKELNRLSTNEYQVRSLIKGSAAWQAGFPEKKDIEIKPQNYDIEVYVIDNNETSDTSFEHVKKVIWNIYSWMVDYKNNLEEEEIESIGKTTKKISKKTTKKTSKKTKRKLENAFCINLSSNIKITVDGVDKNYSCRTQTEPSYAPSTDFKVTDPVQLELYKGWSISLCYTTDKNNEYKQYGDMGACGGFNYSHLIFYVTIYYIKKNNNQYLISSGQANNKYIYPNLNNYFNTDVFNNYLNQIIRTDVKEEYIEEGEGDTPSISTQVTMPYLNAQGLLLYLCFIKMYTSFRESKGLNLEDYRLGLIKGVLGNNFIQTCFTLHQVVNALNFCPNLLPDEFFMYNIKTELVEQMLINYTKDTIPNGIKQKLDDLVISYFRPIMNDITTELQISLAPLGVSVFIAGGDAFERYIPSTKIADIDLKVILTYKKNEKGGQEKRSKLLKDIQRIIIFILSKHTIILNKLIRTLCASNPQVLNGFEEKIFYEALVSREACNTLPQNYSYNFKLCPDSSIPSSFRVRSLNFLDMYGPKFKAGYNLFSMDFRKEFSVFYSANKDYEMNYRYELAILDVPIVLKEIGEWDNNISVVNLPITINDKPFDMCLSDDVTQNFNIPPTIPIASRQFLIEDIAERFVNANLLIQRFYAGKIDKDIERYSQLKKQISQNASINNELNSIQKYYYNSFITNFNSLPLDVRSSIFHYTSIIIKRVVLENAKKHKNTFAFIDVKEQQVPNINSPGDIISVFNDKLMSDYNVKDYKFEEKEDEKEISSQNEEEEDNMSE